MKIKAAITILLIQISCVAFSQAKDSLIVKATKANSEKPGYLLYKVIALNASTSPICILHCTHFFLFDETPHPLALFNTNGSPEMYNLTYDARDTLYIYEGPNDNYNAEIILPYHLIEFNLLIPMHADKKRSLQIDYLSVPDLCYTSFVQEIHNDATQWHRKYKKHWKVVELTE
ncbi:MULTISPECIES: hypothetical protein [Niastella]|uniref:DUF4384 domain-containing protein n=1 Tax=Niastella soli TaxID=2821487 RepID=A0ABS3YRZ1_9BACT|nr:hypothetical protein [Niastella soli]MBO9200215.1 hypothetical protein [Niastella soli]